MRKKNTRGVYVDFVIILLRMGISYVSITISSILSTRQRQTEAHITGDSIR